MTERVRWESVDTLADSKQRGVHLGRQVADSIIARWQAGESANALQAITEHPELKQHRSIVLDLIYEEYCRRREVGETIDLEAMCATFPDYKSSICRQIEVHEYLSAQQLLPEFLPTAQWPNPGDCFLGFELLDEIGRGALARVFLAQEPALGGRLVALKVSRKGASEAEVLGKLEHPNIVPVYSVQEDNATKMTAVCMPYLGRTTLAELYEDLFCNGRQPKHAATILKILRDRSDLDPPSDAGHRMRRRSSRGFGRGTYVDAVIAIASQIAEALAYTHAKGVLHRDLKPSNILLTPDGTARLLDFNLSADLNNVASRVGGTLPYMAPEQVRQLLAGGQASELVDGRADIYSLGVVVFELLYGKHPLGKLPVDKSSDEVAQLVLERQAQLLFAPLPANRQVDDGLGSIVQACLALSPAERPVSADELVGLLRKAASPIRRWRRLAVTYPRVTLSIGALVVAAALSLGIGWALLPPYAIRQYDAGREQFSQREYSVALESFNRAVNYDEGFWSARFARARTRQILGDFVAAVDDYSRAYQLQADPQVAACLGYCLAEQNYHPDAVRWYQKALAAGFESAELYNDLGHSLYKVGDWKAARHNLNLAIHKNRALQTAYHNRALIDVQLAASTGTASDESVIDIDQALLVCSDSADLHYRAACLWAASRKSKQERSDRVVLLLDKAVALGYSPRRLQSDPLLASFSGDDRIRQLLARPEPLSSPIKTPLVVDPLRDAPLPEAYDRRP